MSKTDSLHYRLCEDAAKWIRKNPEWLRAEWKYIAVDMTVAGAECPDVWAFNGVDTLLIEVKVSHEDFLADRRKVWRRITGLQSGNFRYYLAPKGIIKIDELPQGWGLLEYDGKDISRIVPASWFWTIGSCDLRILNSLLVREGFPTKIFNYRKTNYSNE